MLLPSAGHGINYTKTYPHWAFLAPLFTRTRFTKTPFTSPVVAELKGAQTLKNVFLTPSGFRTES